MTISKEDKEYIDRYLTLLIDQQNSMDLLLSGKKKKQKQYIDSIADMIGRILVDYYIEDDRLQIPMKDRKRLIQELKGEVNKIYLKEFKEEEKAFYEEITRLGIQGADFRGFLLSGGIVFDQVPMSLEEVRKIINTEVQGELWSERLWRNKSNTRIQIQNAIDGVISGRITVNEIRSNLEKSLNSNRYNSDRLFNNELARVQTAMENELADKYEVKWQIFISTLDNKTSKICRELSGKKFKANDPNKPNPPLTTHVNCRSALSNIPNKEFQLKLSRDNETGEVIPYMNYSEWVEYRKSKYK